MDIKEGDTVRLKSGGPLMTVEYTDNGKVDCVWFVDGKLFRETFDKRSLEKGLED